MKNTVQKLIVISFVLAIIASVTVLFYLKSLKPPDEVIKNITVLVAAEIIPSRTLIDQKMIKEIQVSDNSIFGDYIKDSSKIIGKYTKDTIFKNDGFITDKLLDKDGNELSLKIDSKHRAISISATGDSGVSDLLKPGDYIDIISYIVEKKDGEKVVRTEQAKIILQNIELLAVNKQFSREDTNTNASDNEKTLANFLITLSVQTSDLEKLVLAESIGSIKLALRPLKDNNIIQTKGTTWEDIYISVNNKGAVSEQKNEPSKISSGSNGNEKYTSYTVKPGDTLKKISREFYGDENKYAIIMEANNIQDENLILKQGIIKIPILQ
ncbi:MAG TPA: Flp pilus assembly protein CpaB [Ruminiclostridium sp.]